MMNYIIIDGSKKVMTANNDSTCHSVNGIANWTAQCDFVRNSSSSNCDYDGIIYPYTELAYCQMAHVRPLAILLFVAVLLLLFVSIGIVADDFLCPSLLTISKTFRLPDHIAGVTFLALGNGSPDIFASLGGIRESKPQLIFSSLFGGGIFVTTVVVGCVLLTGDFALMQRPMIRDITFYIGAAFLVWIFFYYGKFRSIHSFALLVYYLIFIVTIIVSRCIYVRFKRTRAKQAYASELTIATVVIEDVDDGEDGEVEGQDDDDDESRKQRKHLDVDCKTNCADLRKPSFSSSCVGGGGDEEKRKSNTIQVENNNNNNLNEKSTRYYDNNNNNNNNKDNNKTEIVSIGRHSSRSAKARYGKKAKSNLEIRVTPAESRRQSIWSVISKISANGDARERDSAYEDELILRRFHRSGTLGSPRQRSRTSGSLHKDNWQLQQQQQPHHHAHHHLSNSITLISKLYEEQLRRGEVEDIRYAQTIERERKQDAEIIERMKQQQQQQQRSRSQSQSPSRLNANSWNHHDEIETSQPQPQPHPQPHLSAIELAAATARPTMAMNEERFNTVKFVNQKSTADDGSRRPTLTAQLSNASLWSTQSFAEVYSESKDFLIHISPLDILEWHRYCWYRRALEIVKAIPYFIMTVCIPVVDLESTNENWCRMLTCTNIVVAPQAILFLTQVNYKINDTFPLWALLLLVCPLFSVLVFFTSWQHRPPVYHRMFAFIGFAISVIFVQAIANEVINVLTTFGVMLNLSNSILGMTILAWGNSLGDLISDISMARQGYPGMAISACFGGQMMNLLMGIGLPYTILFVGEPNLNIPVEYKPMKTLLFATLMTSLCVSLYGFVLCRFRSSKAHGIVLLAIYAVYLTVAFLIEFQVIPTAYDNTR